MSYTITKARTERDLYRVALLNETIFPSDAPVRIADGQSTWWLVRDTDTGEHVGFCGMHKSPTSYSCGVLERAGLVEQARGKGLHRRMIDVRVQEAKKQGWSKVLTYTVDNPHSDNSLINRGFLRLHYTKEDAIEGVTYWKRKVR
jgi:GNAT superfamily N-acetyltransferase